MNTVFLIIGLLLGGMGGVVVSSFLSVGSQIDDVSQQVATLSQHLETLSDDGIQLRGPVAVTGCSTADTERDVEAGGPCASEVQVLGTALVSVAGEVDINTFRPLDVQVQDWPSSLDVRADVDMDSWPASNLGISANVYGDVGIQSWPEWDHWTDSLDIYDWSR